MSEAPVRSRLSFAAVVALVAGALGLLVVPALLAFIAGVIAMRQTRKPEVRGRGLAMAGMVLGGVLATVTIYSIYTAYRMGLEHVESFAPPVINAAVDNDPTAAAPHSTMSAERLAKLGQEVAGWGKVTRVIDTHWTGRKDSTPAGHFLMAGTAVFDQAGKKPVWVSLAFIGDDLRIADVTFKPPAAAAPAAGRRRLTTAPSTQAQEP